MRDSWVHPESRSEWMQLPRVIAMSDVWLTEYSLWAWYRVGPLIRHIRPSPVTFPHHEGFLSGAVGAKQNTLEKRLVLDLQGGLSPFFSFWRKVPPNDSLPHHRICLDSRRTVGLNVLWHIIFWFQKEHMFCQWPSWTSSLGQRGVDRNPLRSSNPCCHMASLLSRYWVPWEAESWVIPSEGVWLLSRCRAAWLLAWNCRVDTYTFPWQPWAQTTHQPPQSTQTPS